VAKKKVKVKKEHSVRVGGRWFRLRSQKPFAPKLAEEEVVATIPQIRNLAWASQALLVEKLLAGNPKGFPPVIQEGDLTNVRKDVKGLEPRRPFGGKWKHPKLNEEYLFRKVSEGKDPRPLIATGLYIKNIVARERKLKKGTTWTVLPRNIIHRPSGVRLPVLAGWLEFGTPFSNPGEKMPARPHWRPVALVVRRRFKRLPKDIRAAALRKVLRELR
jgi:hypothetical protein